MPNSPNQPYSLPPRHRGSGIGALIMFIIAIFLLSLVFRSGPTAAVALTDWGHDWDSALKSSAKSGKPMLVLFTADWCPPCQQLKREILTDSTVAPQLKEKFTLVKIDLTAPDAPGQQLAQSYAVQGIPTLIVFNPKGEQIGRATGLADKRDMAEWFDRMYAKAVVASSAKPQ